MLKNAGIALVCLLMLSACDRQHQATNSEIIRPVRMVQVGAKEAFSIRKFPGRAEASNVVNLAFEVPGKLNEITLDVGDRVRRGQVIASLDARDYQNVLNEAKAELKRAKAEYERMERALKDRAVSRQALTNSEATYERAKAAVAIRQKAFDDTQLRAPFNAIIAAKYIESFANIQAKQAAIRLVDPTQIEMVADIPENLIALAEVGMEIMVEFDALPGLIVTSTIKEIGTEASASSRTFPVTLIMNQPEGSTILPGMAGRAWRAPEAGLTHAPEKLRGHEVPLSAVLQGADQKTYVWIFDETTERVSRTKIELGDLTRDGVLVRGLQGGEHIATAGVNRLEENQRVRVLK